MEEALCAWVEDVGGKRVWLTVAVVAESAEPARGLRQGAPRADDAGPFTASVGWLGDAGVGLASSRGGR